MERVGRFAVTGVAATLLNLFLLWLLTAKFEFWYLGASVVAFSIAIAFNFAFQKLWTFGSVDAHRVHHQSLQFFAVNVFNLALNTGLLYILVDWFHLWYLLGQAVSSAMIAAVSYRAYRWIFR